MAPVISAQNITPSTLYFSWNEITCGFRRGPELQYEFRLILNTVNGYVIQGWQRGDSASFSVLNACTSYRFEVRAVNIIGPGGTTSKIVSTSEISK